MKNIIIGQYVPGHSFLYKMDPRSKILALVFLMVSTFILKDVLHIFIMLTLVLVILKIGGIPIGRIAKGLKPIMILVFFTFTFQVLFVKSGTILYDEVLNFTLYNIPIIIGLLLIFFFGKRFVRSKILFFVFIVAAIIATSIYFIPGRLLFDANLQIYTDGVSGAFFIMIRLIIIVTLSTILTLTTKPTDLTLGLEQLLKPLRIVRINSEEIALIISIALRYIPTLLDEANKIMLAQTSRGVDFSEGKIKDKVMQVISLLVPMFIISFQRSDDLANAMEARNFIPGAKRTRLHVLSWQKMDTFVVVVSVLAIAGSIVVNVYL